MRRLGVLSKWVMIVLIGTATAAGAAMLANAGTTGIRPEPDCGPTREWNCVVPGCPECPEILFEGTVCEKNQFEAETGRVCSPA